MITRRFTLAGRGALLAGLMAFGLVGETVGRETEWAAPSSSRSKSAPRLAFNAGSHRRSIDARLLAAPPSRAEVKAAAELRKAAEAGDASSQLNLGLCYQCGRGVAKDIAQAVHWFRQAAEQGLDEAQYALGCCYNGDDGYPRDPGAAVKWWSRAAEQGYADAQYCLGLSYYMGEGVAKNPAAAAKWWRKAALQDHADAQYFLGVSYSLGLGVDKIQEEAVYWLRKAATNGNENALAALKQLGKAHNSPANPQSTEQVRPGGSDRTG